MRKYFAINEQWLFQLRCVASRVLCLICGHNWKSQHVHEETKDVETMHWIQRNIEWDLCLRCFNKKDLDVGDWYLKSSFHL